jgi:hypothetical protein
MGRPFYFCFKGFMNQYNLLSVGKSSRVACSEFIMQSSKTSFTVSLSPFSNRGLRQANFFTDLLIVNSIGRKQDNSEAATQSAWHGEGTHIGFKLIAFLPCQLDNWRSARTFSHFITLPLSLCNWSVRKVSYIFYILDLTKLNSNSFDASHLVQLRGVSSVHFNPGNLNLSNKMTSRRALKISCCRWRHWCLF